MMPAITMNRIKPVPAISKGNPTAYAIGINTMAIVISMTAAINITAPPVGPSKSLDTTTL